ncbi:MAG: 23S rRNA (guanosine(2251)-2'-O)-methyltransferase RlmB [Methylotenera sp.]|nr:23S rRNA (guanosine(2251)-2'-O)-methyltransferase RlmB [Oligoflexia bacterium]
MTTLQLRNPHSVLAALQTRPEDVTQLMIPNSVLTGPSSDDAWKKVADLARRHRVAVTSTGSVPGGGGGPRGKKGIPEGGGRAGGAEAYVAEREGISVEELFAGAKERADGKGLWLALDCLQDPHNVGAIFRAAAFFGVQGILLTQERSAPLTSTVYDVACGGVEHVPFTLQVNLQRAFEVAKDKGLWILGTSEHANDSFAKIERDRPWLMVLGNEEKGMRRLTEESCDLLCKVPPQGQVTSLNVSVAAGIFIAKLTGAL